MRLSLRSRPGSGAKTGRSPAVSEPLETRRLLATIGYYDIYWGEGSARQTNFFTNLASTHDFVALDDLATTDFTAFDAIIVRNNSPTNPYKLTSTANGEANPDEFLDAVELNGVRKLDAAVEAGLHLLIHDMSIDQTLTNHVLPGSAVVTYGRNYASATVQRYVDFENESAVLTNGLPTPVDDALDYQSGWSDGYILYGGWAERGSLPGSYDVLLTGENVGGVDASDRVTAFAYNHGAGRVTVSTVSQGSETGGISTALRGLLTTFEQNLTRLVAGEASAVTNTAPVFTDAPAALSAQYSDILGLSFSATDAEADPLTARIVSDGGLNVGDLTETGGVWSAQPVVTAAAGTYEVVLGVSDGTVESTHAVTVTVEQEDATVEYTGLQHFTFAPDTESPTVRLRAAISDASVTDATDTNPGLITNAQVRFFNMDDPVQTLATVAVTPATVGSTDAVIGYAVADVDATVFADGTMRVGVEVIGDYYTGELADGALVTVAFSTAGRVSGGGRMNLSTDSSLRSAGLYAGDAGSEMQYGFSGRYRENTGIYEGDFDATFYSGGNLYRLTSTSIDSLATYTGADGAARANLAATGTLFEVTGKKTQEIVAEGLQIDLTMTDGKGTTLDDSLGLTVWDPAGGLIFSSLWDGTSTLEQEADQGNPIKVWHQ